MSIIAGILASRRRSAPTPQVWIIGDNDGYGAGVPDNGTHSFDGFTPNWDGRSPAEQASTTGAQFTDTYSTTQPGFSPQSGTVATITFTGLGTGWTSGKLTVDMADFQADFLDGFSVTYNGIVQNWNFTDGFPNTVVRVFDLSPAVISSINSTNQLVIVINRGSATDFYGFDYFKLEKNV